MAGHKIIEGLKDAIAGNFSTVTIDGQQWVRATRDGAEGAGVPIICTNSRCDTKPMLAQHGPFAVCPSCGKTYGAAPPKPAPDAMEALAFFMAFFESMPEGTALTLTDPTALDRARARLKLPAPVPSPDKLYAVLRKYHAQDVDFDSMGQEVCEVVWSGAGEREATEASPKGDGK